MNLRLYKWSKKDYNDFLNYLKEQEDSKYRVFHSSLVPEVNEDFIIGVRMPMLREIGKEIAKGNVRSYLEVSSSELYEESMLRGIVTGLVKTQNFEEFAELCDNFVKEINNWAICDCFCSGLKQIKKYKSEFFDYIEKYLNSENVWEIRAGLVIMLDYYLDDKYIDRVFERCDKIDSKVNCVYMAQAWLIATAYVKCEEKTKAYLLDNSLNKVTFNKAIQKCIESKRIDEQSKQYFKTLKRN